MNYRNNRNNVTRQFSPLGYCAVGIAAIIILALFGRILLLLAIIGGIGWLAWKFRWAIRYYFGQFSRKINAQALVYQQKCQKKQSAQQFYSTQCSNPFQTSSQYQPNQTINSGWNVGTTTPAGHRNAIFDVIPEKENK